MKKLRAFRQHLERFSRVDKSKIDAWPENIELQLIAQKKFDGFHFLDLSYEAVFDLEGYRETEYFLFALIYAWLVENDDQRGDLGELSLVVAMTDDFNANVTISIPFVESVYLIESDTGIIEFRGKKWGFPEVGDTTVNIAETFEVISGAAP